MTTPKPLRNQRNQTRNKLQKRKKESPRKKMKRQTTPPKRKEKRKRTKRMKTISTSGGKKTISGERERRKDGNGEICLTVEFIFFLNMSHMA